MIYFSEKKFNKHVFSNKEKIFLFSYNKILSKECIFLPDASAFYLDIDKRKKYGLCSQQFFITKELSFKKFYKRTFSYLAIKKN